MIQTAWCPDERQLRQFAWACPVGFTLLGWLVQRASGVSGWVFAGLGVGVLLLVAGLARPASVRPLYRIGMLLAWPIGLVVSNLLAVLFYFVVITPLGLVMRLAGRDALALRSRGRGSHWREARLAADPRSYRRQG